MSWFLGFLLLSGSFGAMAKADRTHLELHSRVLLEKELKGSYTLGIRQDGTMSVTFSDGCKTEVR